jgi:alkylation response protein AidB-like acyl-CoA dehydrogenase
MGLGIRMVGAAIRQFASPSQLEETIPRLLTGADLWTVLMNEPGSDDPATTTCVADFDWKYVTLNGIKTCPDFAATHAILLARSTPESTGREGLTWFILELGYQPVDQAAGTIQFQNARMLHERVLGTRDDGWAIAKVVLPFNERSFAGRIRRGLVHVSGGSTAGNLHRVVGDVVTETRAQAQARASAPDGVDRRGN